MAGLGVNPPRIRELTLRDIRALRRRSARCVLTFVGYSGAGYRDPAALLACAARVLARFDPASTCVNIGATAAGIGAVYPLARQRGFATMGTVSSLAREQAEPLSPFVDEVFFIRDPSWGGWVPGTRRLSATSSAVVTMSDVLVRIGGGAIAHAECSAARRAGVPVFALEAEPAPR